MGAGDAGGENGLVEVHHLHQLVLDMADLVHAVVVGDGGGGAGHHVTEAGFAHIAGAVVGGEARHHVLGEFVFAVHEHVLVGNENVVEIHPHFLAAVFGVALVDAAAFHGAGVAALATVDIGDALGVAGNHADHGVVLVVLAQVHGRHHADPVLVPAAGHVRLDATHEDAVVVASGHMQEHVLVTLFERPLAAVALGVGHAGGDQHVAALRFLEESQIALVVTGAVLFIDVPGDRVQHAERVQAGAALEAGAGELAQAPLHAVFHHQVLGRLRHVQKAVHGGVDQRRMGGGQFRVVDGQVVGGAQGVDAGPDHRVVGGLVDQFAEQKQAGAATFKAGDVVVTGADHRHP